MAKPSTTPKVITKKHIARLERERRQNRLIVIVTSAVLVIVAALLGYGFYRYNIIAEVNGEKIWASEWKERVKLDRIQMINLYSQYAMYQQLGMDTSQQMQSIASSLSSSEETGKQTLDQMINEILIRQEAKKRGITASEGEVQTAIQESFRFYPNGTPTPTPTPTEFSTPTLSSQQLTLYPSTSTPTATLPATDTVTPTLDLSATPVPSSTVAPATPTFVPAPPTATATPYTEQGFKTEYNKMLENYTKDGVTEKAIRSAYETDVLRKKLMDEITKDTPHTEEQVWARHILVETEAEALAIEVQLQQGADFAKLAKEKSKDTGSGANGGDLDWFGKGQMVPEFETAAFALKIGEISQPVKSQFGYHIIQLLGREDRPMTDSQYQQKKQTEFDDWLKSQKEKANIKTYDVWQEQVPMEPTFQPQQ